MKKVTCDGKEESKISSNEEWLEWQRKVIREEYVKERE